jgi:hypothetical protein
MFSLKTVNDLPKDLFFYLPLTHSAASDYYKRPNQFNSPIAQSVEQVTVNHWVAGSSPARGAKNLAKINHLEKRPALQISAVQK